MGVLNDFNAEAIAAADALGGLVANEDPREFSHNDQYDAFRHAYTSARFAEKYGLDVAKWLGDYNEKPYNPDSQLTHL
jgi:hypothetical protein